MTTHCAPGSPKCQKVPPKAFHMVYPTMWNRIRIETMTVQKFHMKLSPTNSRRMTMHRNFESPALRKAYELAYANCAYDRRRGVIKELARQINALLKGPEREEYRLRMVERRRGRREGREVDRGNEAALAWTGRLRPRKPVG